VPIFGCSSISAATSTQLPAPPRSAGEYHNSFVPETFTSNVEVRFSQSIIISSPAGDIPPLPSSSVARLIPNTVLVKLMANDAGATPVKLRHDFVLDRGLAIDSWIYKYRETGKIREEVVYPECSTLGAHAGVDRPWASARVGPAPCARAQNEQELFQQRDREGFERTLDMN